MKLKSALLTGLAALSLGAVSATTAQAKTWHYRCTASNSFSYSTYHQAFMYGGEYDSIMTLYHSAKDAYHEENSYTNFSDNDHNRTYYARKVQGYSSVMQLKYGNKAYYVNLKDAHLYRYNAWRSGHKIVSFVKPTSKHVLLKAKTNVYASQPWAYNYGGKMDPYYDWYKLSKKGNWYVYR